MTATEILIELARLGVRLEVAGDRLRFRPKEGVTPDLVEALKDRKAEILAALKSRRTETGAAGMAPCGSPHCGGCYEVAPGVPLHPPKVSAEWKAWLEKWQPQSERVQ